MRRNFAIALGILSLGCLAMGSAYCLVVHSPASAIVGAAAFILLAFAAGRLDPDI